jgi:DNA-binding NtrC family response regulator
VPQQPPISFQIRTKNVLIVDGNEAMQRVRARVLRSHRVHVHTAKSVTEAELLWVPDFFDLVLLDVRQRSKEAEEFWRTIRCQHPSQRISFLVGPPTYVSPTRADKVTARDTVPEDRVQRRGILHLAYGLTERQQPDEDNKSRRKVHETAELLTNREAAITADEEHVRSRAYELHEVRGRIDGHAEEDWLQAKGEVAGSNERKAVRASSSKITVKIVGEA